MNTRTTAALVATIAILVLPVAVLVRAPDAAAATTRVLAINGASAHPSVPFKGFDSDPPKVFDFDGDGQLEIVAQNDNQWVYIFDSRSGALLAEVTTTLPTYWGARSFNGPEAAIMRVGDSPRLIVQNSAAVVTSFRLDLLASTPHTKLALVKEWEIRLNQCKEPEPGSDSKPVFADLDRDGTFEIVASTEEYGVYALRADGTVLWKNCLGGGNAEPGIGDLNQDGYPDVVFGSDGGVIAALNGRTGAWLWGYNLLAHFNIGSGSMPVGVTVEQLDGVGGPDVVVGARDSHDANNWSNDHALLVALSSGGSLLWAKQDLAGGAPLTYTHAVVVDTDGNGQKEVYWADWNTIGHKPPWTEADAWKVTGPAHFYRYTANGTLVWKQSLPTWWNNKDVPLADVDADGVQEMLANAPGPNGHDGIWYLDSRNGAKESFVDVFPWKVARAPVVADMWGTGTMQWVVEGGQFDPSSGGPGILLYDTGAPY
ncbi:MAG: VCBS repeat-containing protein, partial [Halobacteriales archaeon]|nr:VCBS repeat-containing protein [Halobacteriales archaeon]